MSSDAPQTDNVEQSVASNEQTKVVEPISSEATNDAQPAVTPEPPVAAESVAPVNEASQAAPVPQSADATIDSTEKTSESSASPPAETSEVVAVQAAEPQVAAAPELAPAPEPASAPAAVSVAAPKPVTAPESVAVPAPQPEATAATQESAESSVSKPRLNPTPVGNSRAVPSLEPVGGVAEDGTPIAPPATIKQSEPVELPSDESLDSNLAAEIEAAMGGGGGTDSAETPTEATPAIGAASIGDEEELEEGSRVTGTVQSVDDENIFLDIGVRSNGIIQRRNIEVEKLPAVGDQLEVIIAKIDAAEGLIHVILPDAKRRSSANWDNVKVGEIVDATITKTNKGGLEVTVSSLRGFLPASQIDVRYVGDLEEYVGQKLTVKVTEVNPKRRNLIVSRRAIIENERKEQEAKIWEELEVGQVRQGKVKTIKDYGAFIDIGGFDGFLHIGEISWSRLKHPSEMLKVEETVDVQIITIDPEKRRVGLGMRQLRQNPWQAAGEKYPPGAIASGKVTRTTNFGAFVELEQHVEGLVHISELDHKRVNQVTDMLNVGDMVEMKVLEVDLNRKRIALSLKAMKEQPADAMPSAHESIDDAPVPPRPRNESLLGGMGGGGAGGGMFGNPDDYKK